MPLAGGPSDKAGNSFERRWTVLTLADLLLGHGQSLRIEVPGEQGEGAEFRLLAGGVPEWHQAKRQRGGGPWTITNMATEGSLRRGGRRSKPVDVACSSRARVRTSFVN
jgi:hypothetical protein